MTFVIWYGKCKVSVVYGCVGYYEWGGDDWGEGVYVFYENK